MIDAHQFGRREGIGSFFQRLAHAGHHEAFIALSKAENERDELNIEFGRLQIEQATWSETNRVEQIATSKLGMKFPEGADVVVVQP